MDARSLNSLEREKLVYALRQKHLFFCRLRDRMQETGWLSRETMPLLVESIAIQIHLAISLINDSKHLPKDKPWRDKMYMGVGEKELERRHIAAWLGDGI